MSLLFLYPLRKRVRFFYNLGAAKYWFFVHLCCGIVGPLLIVGHTALQFRSINATVAFVLMLIIVFAGFIGRYMQVNRLTQMWHVLHVPLSYLLLIVVIFHVIWVHMYL
jgi:hypothetical protein